MWRWVLCLCGWCVLNAPVTLAKSPALTGSAIKHLVSGTVMYINTPLNTKIPVRYGADGKLAGAAGSMSFYLGAAKDTGRWWVARGRLCHKWSRWFDGDTQCLKLRRSGNQIFWASDTGRTGTAYITRSKTPKPRTVASRLATSRKANVTAQPSMAQVREPPRAARPAMPHAVETVKEHAPPAKTAARKSKPAHKPAGTVAPKIAVKKTNMRGQAKTKTAGRSDLADAASAKRVPKSPSSATPSGGTAWARLPTFRVARVADFDVLNIRKGPGEYHAIVGRIPPTARDVKIVGACRSWWCPVQHRTARGWVNRFYLSQDR